MKRRAVLFLALAFALVPPPVRAEDERTVLLYARALQRFNPQLEASTAMPLARATLVRADEQGIDARLLVAVIAVESRWHPSAVSRAGARGLAQLMPQTAAALGIDAADPYQNIAGAARHLRRLLDRFATYDRPAQYELALAAYNAGLGSVERFGGLPPYRETHEYVRRVLRLWRRLAGA